MGISIPITVPGAVQLLSVLDRMDSSVSNLSASIRKLNGLNNQLGSSGNNGAAGIRKVGQSASQAVGPLQRLAAAQNALASANASGDPSRIFDAQYRVHLAQRSYARAKNAMSPPSFGNLLSQAIFSTRIGFGGGGHGGLQISPLVGRMGQLIGRGMMSGGGAAAGGAGVAGAAGLVAVGVIVAFVAALSKARDAVNRFSQTAASAFGTPGQTTTLMRLSDALGIDAGSAASSFGSRIGNGGLDASLARRLGINPRNSFFSGNTNDAQKYLKALEQIANMSDDGMAARYAKQLGLPEAMRLREASPDVRKRFLSQQNELANPAHRRAVADFNLELANLKQSFEKAVVALAPFLKVISMIAGVVASVVTWVIDLYNKIPAWLKGLTGIGDLFSRSGSKKNDALDKNTQAIMDNTAAMNNFRQIFSQGPRAGSAIPSAWGYETLRRAQLGELANLGAFSL